MLDRYTKGQPVVIQRKVGSLLGIVVDTATAPPRYTVQPARLVNGQPQAIAAALAVPHVHARKLQAYNPTIHTNPWRLA